MSTDDSVSKQDVANSQDDNELQEPGVNQVYQFMMYGISLPERALRATSAMVGGAIRESASLVVPQAFRDSRSYRMFVSQMLDFVSTDVGGVKSAGSGASTQVEGFVAKKAVSNFVELAGMATLHVSPLLILAVVSDLAHGSKTFLGELSVELKKQGIIDERSTIDSTADLLAAISKTSGDTASVFDLPPLNVEGLKETIQKTRDSLNSIDPTQVIPQSEITRVWEDMKSMANRQNVDLFQLSSAMTLYTLNGVGATVQGALTTVRVSGQMLDRHIISHYSAALNEINNKGIYPMLATASKPYLDAVWYNFTSDRPTVTEDLVTGRFAGRAWEGLRGWMGKK